MKHPFQSSQRAKKNIQAVTILSLLVLISFIMSSLFSLKNYNILLNADTMKVYSNGILITSVNEPRYMMDTFNGSVGVGVVDSSELGVSRFGMSELLRLKFIKDDKTISVIKLFAPKNPDDIDKHTLADIWMEFEGNYVIMNENGNYFLFGDDFFSELAKVFNGNTK